MIGLGAADVLTGSPRTLGLLESELDSISAGTLQIGDGNSGSMVISVPVSHNNNLALTSAGAITFNSSVTMSTDRNFSATSSSLTSGIALSGASSDITTSGTGSILISANRNVFMNSVQA